MKIPEGQTKKELDKIYSSAGAADYAGSIGELPRGPQYLYSTRYQFSKIQKLRGNYKTESVV